MKGTVNEICYVTIRESRKKNSSEKSEFIIFLHRKVSLNLESLQKGGGARVNTENS